MKSLRWLVAPLVCFSAIASAQFSAFVGFGDSLSDTGNVNNLTFGISPGGNYWQGRFSNGLVWSERFAASLGLSATASRLGGTNYAHGGATSGGGTSSIIIPNMSSQVGIYLSNRTPNATTLYSLWAGGNDYLNGSTNVSGVVQNIRNDITTLHGAGARKFFVPGLPLLGNIPRNIGTANQAAFNTRSLDHNTQLQGQLNTLRGTLAGVEIYYFDVAGTFEAVRANPSAFGITNTSQAALTGNNVVPNVDEYLFFDDIHPTRAGHALLAEGALRAVPEPMTLAVLGLAALAARRRNRRAK